MRVMVKSTHKLERGESESYYGIPMTMHEGGWLVSDDLDEKATGVDALLDAGSVIEFNPALIKAGAGSARARASAASAAATAQAAAQSGGGEGDGDEPMGERRTRKRE